MFNCYLNGKLVGAFATEATAESWCETQRAYGNKASYEFTW